MGERSIFKSSEKARMDRMDESALVKKRWLVIVIPSIYGQENPGQAFW